MMTDTNTTKSNPVKATVYMVGDFGGFQKIEGHMYDHGRRKYAQYDAAPFVDIKAKRKRSIMRYTKGYKPTLVIFAGWGLPEIRDLGAVKTSDENATVTAYGLMFGESRSNNYNDFIDNLTKSATLIADYREKE